ncbi:MAG TPA: NAD(P)-dependent oxidoreductase [Terriglobales bacterium]|nr:NAD(P)-dependent oxidoreductase [Terriglobales bacterium]
MLNRRQRYDIDVLKPEKQDAGERVHNWNEVYQPYTIEMAVIEAQRCLLCEHAPCMQACPLHNDIPGAFFLLGEGDVVGAAEKFLETSNMPDVCGRICPQEKLCEGACVVAAHKAPVTIGKLEAFVVDHVRQNYGYPPRQRAPRSGMYVAVVGAGPAGLAVAEELAVRGHDVVVYDAWPVPGGLLLYGIPNFKLDKEMVFEKLRYLEGLGIRFICDYHVGRDHPVEALLHPQTGIVGAPERGFDLMFLGYGAVKGGEMKIEGEHLRHVYQATEYLVRGNLPPEFLPPSMRNASANGSGDFRPHTGAVTIVVGGGDTGMDCVRTARRLNPDGKVYCLYRRTEAEMLGRMEERIHAREEGVIFEYLTLPIRFLGDEAGAVKAAECVRMQLGEPDAKGRRSPVPIEGSNFILPCDTVALAIGYNVDTEIPETTPELRTTPWGSVIVQSEETGQTSREEIYAAGDDVRGADLVVTALAAARKAAVAMDRRLATMLARRTA